jgi:hypothetical protein
MTPTLPMSLGSRRTIGPWLQAGNEQQIHNLYRVIFHATHPNRAATRRTRQKFWMLDGKNSSVRQMNIEWLERPGLMHLLQLFDCHRRNSTSRPSSRKLTRNSPRPLKPKT